MRLDTADSNLGLLLKSKTSSPLYRYYQPDHLEQSNRTAYLQANGM